MRYFFLLLVVHFSLCYKSQTFTIVLTTQPSSCSLGRATLTTSGGTGPYAYAWSNGGTGSFQNNLDSGFYNVKILDAVGKDSTFYFRINTRECPITVSGDFSPNGDGINDFWTATIQNYSEFLIQIYNRWGQKVHEAKSEYVKWDGKRFGLPVPDGTYYYIIEYEDPNYGPQLKKGNIIILR